MYDSVCAQLSGTMDLEWEQVRPSKVFTGRAVQGTNHTLLNSTSYILHAQESAHPPACTSSTV